MSENCGFGRWALGPSGHIREIVLSWPIFTEVGIQLLKFKCVGLKSTVKSYLNFKLVPATPAELRIIDFATLIKQLRKESFLTEWMINNSWGSKRNQCCDRTDRESRIQTRNYNLFTCACGFIQYAIGFENIVWTTVSGSNRKQCLLIKTTHAVVYTYSLLCIFISQNSNKVDFISKGETQMGVKRGPSTKLLTSSWSLGLHHNKIAEKVDLLMS